MRLDSAARQDDARNATRHRWAANPSKSGSVVSRQPRAALASRTSGPAQEPAHLEGQRLGRRAVVRRPGPSGPQRHGRRCVPPGGSISAPNDMETPGRGQPAVRDPHDAILDRDGPERLVEGRRRAAAVGHQRNATTEMAKRLGQRQAGEPAAFDADLAGAFELRDDVEEAGASTVEFRLARQGSADPFASAQAFRQVCRGRACFAESSACASIPSGPMVASRRALTRPR